MKFMKNILGLNGCGIFGEHILYGIMEKGWDWQNLGS